ARFLGLGFSRLGLRGVAWLGRRGGRAGLRGVGRFGRGGSRTGLHGVASFGRHGRRAGFRGVRGFSGRALGGARRLHFLHQFRRAVAEDGEGKGGRLLVGHLRELLGAVVFLALEGGAGEAEEGFGVLLRLRAIVDKLGGVVFLRGVGDLKLGGLLGELIGGGEIALGEHGAAFLRLGAGPGPGAGGGGRGGKAPG